MAERHEHLHIVLIRGNHDRNAGDPPASLRIEVKDEPWILEPFALQHEPRPHTMHPVLAGHVHPAFVLRGKARQRVRLPCFLIDEGVSLLPAFGEFTGGWTIAPGATGRIYLAGAGRVWAL
ncbi:DEAD/DEAH box helicase [Pseudomonas putida]|nr:DEAD/DEAH box helicase [Pseudomonas putida]